MRGKGVSSATTDLDQKYLLQNQSQRHQYFIIGEPARRHATPLLQPFLLRPLLSEATTCLYNKAAAAAALRLH